MDQDNKKYGTIRIDNGATAMAAGVFMHLARLLKPYKPERSEELQQRAEKAMAYVGNNTNDRQKLYFAVQKYLLTGDNTAHQQIKDLINSYVTNEENDLTSSNASDIVLSGFIYPYIIEKERPTDLEVVQQMKDILRNAADREIEIFNSFAYPVGNPFSTRRRWGSNVTQGRHAYPCLLEWSITKEQKYIDVVSQLMDYTQGLNPIGKCYVTGIGFDQVKNPHDRESEYTKSKGWGVKPGILIYGPGNLPDRIQFKVLPEITDLPRERQWVDHLYTYGMNEFTIHETLIYPAVIYPVLAEGKVWDETKDPFDVAVSSSE
jgi:endoglucanase